MMMWDFIEEKLNSFPSSWFYDGINKFQYGEIKEQTFLIGNELKKRISRKSKCAIICDNGMMSAIAILSCWYADIVPVPMSKNYGEKHCISIIEETHPDIMLTDEEEYFKKFGLFTYNIKNKRWLGNYIASEYESELEDIAIIMSTSGTTGRPKGVLISDKGLISNIKAIDNYFEINQGDIILVARPLYHCAVFTGEFLISIYKGLNICFYSGEYNPVAIINCVTKWEVTVLCGTPTMFHQLALYMIRQNRSCSLRIMAISGECLTKQVANRIKEVFKDTDIYNVYGLTEASPRVSYLPPKLFKDYSESVGIPLIHTNIEIHDDNGNELPSNQSGNVIVKSPSIMKGYYKNERLTKEKITTEGLKTGDIGYKDENGYLYILSRSDDMIIKAGMNIYPREIEKLLENLPFINEIVAYGKKEEYGQKIAIKLVLKEEFTHMDQREIMNRFSECLPNYLMPNYIEVLKKLERNGSGKILRPRI